MPQANSTTSWPQSFSQRIVEDLPVFGGDDGGELALAESAAHGMRRAPVCGAQWKCPAKAGNAALAAAIGGVAHSSSVAKATCPVTFPVAGFVTGAVRPPGGTWLPLIQCSMMFKSSAQGVLGCVASSVSAERRRRHKGRRCKEI